MRSTREDDLLFHVPPPLGSIVRFVTDSWNSHPVLTILGGVLFLGVLGEALPIFLFGMIGITIYSFSKDSDTSSAATVSTKNASDSPPPKRSFWGSSKTTVDGSVEERIAVLEEKLSRLQESEQELLERTDKLGKPKKRSMLASLVFLFSLSALTVPLFLVGTVGVSKYLNRPELSNAFLHTFNEMHLDHALVAVNPVDFDFFASFFGVILVPAFFMMMVSFLVGIRTLFKRQKGLFLAFTALFFYTLNFASFGILWKGLMNGAHYWTQESQQLSTNSLEDLAEKLQNPHYSFAKKVVAVKSLQELDTPEAHQVLFESLPHNNAILQQLMMTALTGHLDATQVSQIEALVQETHERQFQKTAVRLISTIPDKEVAYKIFEYDFGIPSLQLMERFEAEDIPMLEEKLINPQTKNRLAVLHVLNHLDSEKAYATLQRYARSHDEDAQELVLRFLRDQPRSEKVAALLQELKLSPYPPVYHRAKHLERHLFRKNHRRRAPRGERCGEKRHF